MTEISLDLVEKAVGLAPAPDAGSNPAPTEIAIDQVESAIGPLADRDPTADDRGEFMKGVLSGTDQMQASLGAGVEMLSALLQDRYKDSEFLGTVRDWGRQVRERNLLEARQYRPNVARVEDVRTDTPGNFLGDVADYGAYQLGNVGPSLLTSAGGAVAGGAAGTMMGGPAGGVAGGVVGAFTPSYLMNAGEVYSDLLDEGYDRPDAAAKAGIPMALLDVIEPTRIGGRVLFRPAKQAAKRGLVRRIAGEGAKGAVLEGIPEAAQEAIGAGTVAEVTGKEFWTPETVSALLNAGLAGGIAGGAMGGASGVVPDRASPPDTDQQPPEPVKPVRQAAQAPVTDQVQEALAEQPPEPQQDGSAADLTPPGAPAPGAVPPPPRPPALPDSPPEPDDVQPWSIPFSAILANDDGGAYRNKKVRDEAQALHRRYVEQAVGEGQPVPPEVLAEYPDLAPRLAPQSEPATEPLAPGRPAPGTRVRVLAPDGSGEFGEATIKGYQDGARPRVVFDEPVGPLRRPYLDLVTMEPVEAVSRETQVEAAARDVDPAPTEGMKEAGNYRKGHVRVQGLDVSIETARGQERSGTGPDGESWSVTMPAHYGYVRRTEGADGEQVDVYLGPDPESERVFLVDQIDPMTSRFDEHKAMLGFPSREEAEAAYDRAFSDGRGPERRGAVTEMDVGEFRDWLRDGDTKKPLAWAAPATTDATEGAAEPETVGAEPGVVAEDAAPEPAPAGGPVSLNEVTEQAEAVEVVPEQPETAAPSTDGQRADHKVVGEPEVVGSRDTRLPRPDGAVDRVYGFGKTKATTRPPNNALVIARGEDGGGEHKVLRDRSGRTFWYQHTVGGSLQDLVKTTSKEKGEQWRAAVAEMSEARNRPAAAGPKRHDGNRRTDKIEDFGEKIEGARKDTFAGFRDSLKDEIDLVTEPLSKIFPIPDYQKLAEAGAPKEVLAYIAIMRDMIPNKPRMKWKVERWAKQVEVLRNFSRQLLDDDISVEALGERAKGAYLLRDLPLTAEAIADVDPADLPVAAKYRISSGTYSMLNGERYDPAKTFWHLQGPSGRRMQNPFSNDPAMPGTERESPEEAVALAKKIIARALSETDQAPAQTRSKYTKVGVYRDRSAREVFLGFKVRSTVIRLKSGFDDAKAAREYLDENRDDIQAKIDEMRAGPNMRGAENRPRSGESLRDGDVTPEMFTKTFGFRGVQFGNYVEGGRRQADLNRAYDALMDLADAVGVPSEALSLNGSLGLAFGARGRGGKNAAAAHYEPGNIVINLTKGGGPGSLAHEWLHALDNYFARQDEAGGYMSERRRVSGPVRDEVYQAWKAVEEAIGQGPFAERSAEFDKARSKPYWNTTTEKAARAFEKYMIDRLSEKGAINDYLANIDDTGGAYPSSEEMERGGIKAAYDRLFNAVEAKETESGVALFARRSDQGPALSAQDFDAIHKRLVNRLRPGAKTQVVETYDDLPAAVKRQARQEGIEPGEVSAAWHDGKIYLVRDAIPTRVDLERAILHEAYGHFGARRLFGAEVTAAMAELYDALGGEQGIRDLDQKHGLGMAGYFETAKGMSGRTRAAFLADELVAHMQGRRALETLPETVMRKVREVWGLVRKWMREKGLAELSTFGDADLAALLSGIARSARTPAGRKIRGTRFAAAYHGTPHDVDQFSTENVGTGEGAASYGWGLYFASRKGVGEHYRKALSANLGFIDRTGAAVPQPPFGTPEEFALQTLIEMDDFSDAPPTMGSYDDAREAVRNLLKDTPSETQRRLYRGTLKALDRFEKDGVRLREGHLYTVDLAPAEDEYLHWDLTLDEQPAKVRAALEATDWYPYAEAQLEDQMPTRNPGGDDLYHWLLQDYDPRDASLLLREAGIPGIKYLDGASRAKGAGSYNYVIFDDSLVTITERDGEPVDDTRFSRAGLIRAAAPILRPKGHREVRYTDEQRAVLDKIMGNRDKPFRERIRDLVQDFKEYGGLKVKQAMIDQFAVIERLEREAAGGKLLDAMVSPYKAARMTQNLHSVMAAVLRHGPIEIYSDPEQGGSWFRLKEGWEDGGLEDILTPLAEQGLLHLWKGWAMANRAQRLMAEGRENLMSEHDIAVMLEAGREHRELFEEALAKWQRFNGAMLDMAEQAGLINREQRALWEHDDYVPFYRLLEGEDQAGPGQGKRGIANQRSGIRRLKGGEAQVNDLVENMVMNLTSLTSRAMKNLAAQKVTALAADAGVMTPKAKNWKPAMVPATEAIQKIGETLGVDVNAVPDQVKGQWLKLFQITAPTEPNVVSVMVDGEPRYFEVHEPLLLGALTSMTPRQLTGVMGVFRMAKRALTEGVTMDPAFMVANALRDTLSAWVVTGQKGFVPGRDSVAGFVKSLRSDASLLGIMAAGGGSGGFYRTGPEDVRKMMDSRIRGIDENTVLDTPKKLWEAWHRIGAASESANRVGIYDAVRKNGGSEAEAAFQALDLMDFSMRGDSAAMRTLIEMVPFLNARLQGLYRGYRGVRDNPRTFLLRGSILVAATMAVMATNWDRPEYEELEDWDKDTYLHFWIDDQHYRLPKPFEVGAVFMTVPERVFRALTGQDDGKKSGQVVARMFLDTFAFNPTPQLLMPLVEQYANKSFFTGRPIVGMGLERLPEALQSKPGTGETAKLIGRVLPEFTGRARSPARIEHLIKGYLGTLGTYLLAASDAMVGAFTDPPAKPEMRIDDYPVVKRFLREDPARTTRYVTEFYDLKREVEKTVAGIREMRRRGEIEEARDLLREKRDKVAMYKAVTRAGRAMASIGREMRRIDTDPEMKPGEKRRHLDRLTRQRNDLAKRMVERAPALSRLMAQMDKGRATRERLARELN